MNSTILIYFLFAQLFLFQTKKIFLYIFINFTTYVIKVIILYNKYIK